MYFTADIKSPNSGHVFSKIFDYIKHPKEDGYRGIHLVYKYRSESIDKAAYSGQRIEIQIRSKLQHAWATAVETAQLFTGQALKSRLKNANESWLRFFALMGSAIAEREKCPIVSGTPENSEDRIAELKYIVDKEKILESLAAWNNIILVRDRVGNKDSKYFLLRLDIIEQRLQVLPYTLAELQKAQAIYSEFEKEYEGNEMVQVVLVSVDSIDALRKAYPNYDIDTTEFIKAVKHEINSSKRSVTVKANM